MGQTIIYGPGGLDTSKENNNILSIEDYEDQPIVEAPLEVPAAAVNTFLETLEDPATNSIAEIKSALKDFLNEMKAGQK